VPPCIDVILQQRLEQIISNRKVTMIVRQASNGVDGTKLGKRERETEKTVTFFCCRPFRNAHMT
jgi:hypothetical protein